jgi:hypothetical protein
MAGWVRVGGVALTSNGRGSSAIAEDRLEQLDRLGRLRDTGVPDEREKAQILGSAPVSTEGPAEADGATTSSRIHGRLVFVLLLPHIGVWVIGLVDIAQRPSRGAAVGWIPIVLLLPGVGTLAHIECFCPRPGARTHHHSPDVDTLGNGRADGADWSEAGACIGFAVGTRQGGDAQC